MAEAEEDENCGPAGSASASERSLAETSEESAVVGVVPEFATP